MFHACPASAQGAGEFVYEGRALTISRILPELAEMLAVGGSGCRLECEKRSEGVVEVEDVDVERVEVQSLAVKKAAMFWAVGKREAGPALSQTLSKFLDFRSTCHKSMYRNRITRRHLPASFMYAFHFARFTQWPHYER